MYENILHINSFVVVFPRGSHWCALPPRRGILHLKLFGLESYLIKFETLKKVGLIDSVLNGGYAFLRIFNTMPRSEI